MNARTDAPHRLPNFLGIGAPKAATTWLHRCLRQHPEVFAPEVKEINFFAYLDAIDHRLNEYAGYFRDAGPHHRAVGEFSTNYLAFERAPIRVKRHLPDCRFIVALRNPREQVVSHYWHLRRQQFHVGGKRGYARKPMPSLQTALVDHRAALVEPALYATHLERWLQHFERDRFHVILYDDVTRDPKRVLRELYEFLGVDPEFQPPSLEQRDTATRRGVSPRSSTFEAAYRFVYQAANRHVYKRLKDTIGWSRADALKRRLRARELLEWVWAPH
jgi:hypothetical protein